MSVEELNLIRGQGKNVPFKLTQSGFKANNFYGNDYMTHIMRKRANVFVIPNIVVIVTKCIFIIIISKLGEKITMGGKSGSVRFADR